MTARELIDLLSALPPETLILVSGYEAGLSEPATPFVSHTVVRGLREDGTPSTGSVLGEYALTAEDSYSARQSEPMTAFVIPRP